MLREQAGHGQELVLDYWRKGEEILLELVAKADDSRHFT